MIGLSWRQVPTMAALTLPSVVLTQLPQAAPTAKRAAAQPMQALARVMAFEWFEEDETA